MRSQPAQHPARRTTFIADIEPTVLLVRRTGQRSSSTDPGSGSGRSGSTLVAAARPTTVSSRPPGWSPAISRRSGTIRHTTHGRGSLDHVHTSTLAGILAGLRAAGELGVDASRERAVTAAEAGLVDRLIDGDGALTKWQGNDAVDGSLLWAAAPYGLLQPDAPVFAATLARIEADLVSVDGGVHRYLDDTYYGGGEWLLLTSGLGRVYLRRGGPGDRDRAADCLAWIEAQATPDGALPEQVATRALYPDRIAEWTASWGPSASPLLWSHAAYLALRSELE